MKIHKTRSMIKKDTWCKNIAPKHLTTHYWSRCTCEKCFEEAINGRPENRKSNSETIIITAQKYYDKLIQKKAHINHPNKQI